MKISLNMDILQKNMYVSYCKNDGKWYTRVMIELRNKVECFSCYKLLGEDWFYR